MKFAIVVHGRFFAFDLVRALVARNKNVVLLTNYPKWAVRRFGIPTSCVESFWLHGVASRLFERLTNIGIPIPEATLHRAFGRWAASRLRKSDAEVVFSFSGISEEILTALSKSGKRLLLARCSTHIDAQREILHRERSRSGYDTGVPSDWMIRRERREYELADAVVVLSSFARQTFLDASFPAHRIRLLPLGSDLSHFRPAAAVTDERRRRIMEGKPLRVLYVGALSLRKGAVDLLSIVETASRCERFEFRIVGPVERQMRPVARALSSYAKLVPKQAQSKLAEYYAWADLFIFPTLEDGYAVVLAQAQSGCLPVLATSSCSGPDIIEEGKTGWICAPKDPEAMVDRLLWCNQHRKELATMINDLCLHCKTRDWRAVAEDFEALATGVTEPSHHDCSSR